jgi:hypothetical protein
MGLAELAAKVHPRPPRPLDSSRVSGRHLFPVQSGYVWGDARVFRGHPSAPSRHFGRWRRHGHCDGTGRRCVYGSVIFCRKCIAQYHTKATSLPVQHSMPLEFDSHVAYEDRDRDWTYLNTMSRKFFSYCPVAA